MASTGHETLPRPLTADADAPAPSISVVIPVYNEAASLAELYTRAVESLDRAGHSFELIFVDDGSTDATFSELERLHAADGRVRAVRFKRNFGQHSGDARRAGSRARRGAGHDGRRPSELAGGPAAPSSKRSRTAPMSRAAPGPRAATPGEDTSRPASSTACSGASQVSRIADFGCAFNAYRRARSSRCWARSADRSSRRPSCFRRRERRRGQVEHSPRAGGSRYSPLRLTRLALHVLAGFWPQPIQWIGVALGALCTTARARAWCVRRRLLDRRSNFRARSSEGWA